MILATNNKGKIKEIKSILKEFELISLKEAKIDIDVEEDADTFYGNALKKAKEIYDLTKESVIADDSGLCIEGLNGFPGVLTHRFLGENATDEERNEALIKKVDLECGENRKAQIVCNLVYYDGTNTVIGEGVINGFISTSPRGENGFGFDPIFELENGLTLAELSSEEKNLISARKIAAEDLKKKL